MATFVLVHGACHGGWCYSRVAPRLATAGHDVYTPTLSGVSDRAHLADHSINLSTHIQDIVALIETYDLNDVVLCGHSYGGMVITGVAGKIAERIKTLFYIDGCVPEDGQSLFDIAGPDRARSLLEAAGETGTMMDAPSAAFFQVNAEDRDWVDRMCTPHPIACFIQKLNHTGREVAVTRRTYVRAERYHSINEPTYDKVRNLPGWKAVLVDCGHDVMIDEPGMLAMLLLEELDR